ncbi:DUF2156 domain-containing protein [Sinomonas sp. ASV322]|uniref:DUF2156 domain-containing protein n=1 Tax=Sinomonas sp. ASV322 TaxID=3041920 RepID=UPI0027DDFAA6|nr:DUF2156 domain-containing protein [Sinomonas sp. ASV322]MDQ4502064.1 DUF2156 domain-containing protein [Sinomonas sp. ASV322]
MTAGRRESAARAAGSPVTSGLGRPRFGASGALADAMREAVRRWLGALGRYPVTLTIVAVFWIVGLASDSILAGPDQDLYNLVGGNFAGLRGGQWWTPITSVFFASNPFAYLAGTVVIAGLVPLAERVFRPWRTLVLFFGGQLASLIVFFTLAQLARWLGDDWLGSMVDVPILGPYPAALACGLAASGSLGALLRRRVRAVVLVIAGMLVLYVGHSETVLGLIGALVGLVAGWWTAGPAPERHFRLPSIRERRNLLSLLVAVVAIGPLLTAFSRSPTGPLALVRGMVLNPLPVLAQIQQDCAGSINAVCLPSGPPTVLSAAGYLTALLPVLILLVCAEGLRRGRSVALRVAVGVQLAVFVLAAGYIGSFLRIPYRPGPGRTGVLGSSIVHVLPVVIAALALVVVLWMHRDLFPVETARGMRRRLQTAGAALAGGLVSLYVVLWFKDGGTGRPGGVWGLVEELVRQYLPSPLPTSYAALFRDRDGFELWLFTYSGLILWAAALAGVVVAVLRGQQTLGARDDSLHLARRLVHRGGSSLSWMTLWPPNRFWFDEHAAAGIAFQQHGSVALSVAGPIGSPGRGPAALEGFIGYCSRHALVPCFYSLTEDHWPLLRERGFRRVEVAQETRLRIRELEFKGKDWQNVRTAVNRARKTGVKAEWVRYVALSPHRRSQLHILSEEWSARKTLPDMGFTLGGLDELADPEVLLCLAVDGEGGLHGATSWLPVYSEGQIVSWTLDFMRRSPDGFPGVMEFLVASAVSELGSTVDTISLSGSPLAADPAGERAAVEGQDELLGRILEATGHALEPIYGFRSLARFKSHFQPEYRALYMYYQDSLQLPAIGRALAEAYLPGLTMRHRMRLLRTLVR